MWGRAFQAEGAAAQGFAARGFGMCSRSRRLAWGGAEGEWPSEERRPSQAGEDFAVESELRGSC